MSTDTTAQPLRTAAQAVLDRWDSPKWEWQSHGPTADLMADLRKALAASPQPAVGAQVERGVGPCAYRLRDAEAQSWLYYSDDELHDAAKAALSPLYDQAALAAVRDRCEKLRAFVQEVADHAFEHHQDYWAIRANEVFGA